MILLTGATGYVGRHLLQRLHALGRPVRCLVLPGDPSDPTGPGVEVVRGDLQDQARLQAGLTGAAAVVHCASLMLPNSADRIQAVNVEGTRTLIQAARAAGVRRIVYLSAVSAVYAEKNSYGRSKAEAERLLAESGLEVTVLRPTMVYGPSGALHFAKLVETLRRIPLVAPIVGSGAARLQPVFIGDVVDAIERVLDDPRTIGRTYNVSGATVVRFDVLLDRICAEAGLRRVKLRVPLWLCHLAARVLSLVPGSFVTPESVLGLTQDATLDHSSFREECGYHPVTLDVGLKRVFGRS